MPRLASEWREPLEDRTFNNATPLSAARQSTRPESRARRQADECARDGIGAA
jgi:hypothetical protein